MVRGINKTKNATKTVEGEGTDYTIIVQISTASGETIADEQKQPLRDLLTTVADSNPNYYSENDRFNGKTYDANGHWATFTAAGGPRATAAAVLANPESAAALESAYSDLQDAIAALLPRDCINPTTLYEAMMPDGSASTGEGTYYAAHHFNKNENTKYTTDALDNCTSASAAAFRAACAEAETLFANLRDFTEADLTRITQFARATKAALADQAAYEAVYNSYQSNREAIESLLAQCAARMSEEDYAENYTQASRDALSSAYQAVNSIYPYNSKGGFAQDVWTLAKLYVPQENEKDLVNSEYLNLIAAYRGLVSTKPVTVQLSYVDNAAARAGDEIKSYQKDALALSEGSTTVYDALGKAFLPQSAGANHMFVVLVNGQFYGTDCAAIQLHDGDRVSVARVEIPTVQTEAASGLDSSIIQDRYSTQESAYRDSVAEITLSAPATAAIGEKVALSVAVKGANGGNLNETFSPAGVTLFISTKDSPYASIRKTTAGADGKLEYTFSEPGWYTVAVVNTTNDFPQLTDIYSDVTPGTYYSLHVGSAASIEVTAADETVLMESRRPENLAQAKAYYDSFHDYDFAGNDYTTFTELYDTLKANQKAATTFKALMDSFEADYAALQAQGGEAMDHTAVIAALKADVALLPENLDALDYTHQAAVEDLRNGYGALNDYQKTLLTPAETAEIEAILAYAAAHPEYAALGTQITISASGELPISDGAGNTQDAPNYNKIFKLSAGGKKEEVYYKWGTIGNVPTFDAEAVAYPGYLVAIRRLCVTTDEQYWLQYSVDGGTTWNLPDGAADSTQKGDKLFALQYTIPMDYSGTTLDFKLKMISKSEYDVLTGVDVESTRTAALAAVQAAYDFYDMTKYDADGQAALLTALNKGLEEIRKAEDGNAIAVARKTAVGTMAAVPKKSGESQNAGDYDYGTPVGRVHVLIENTTYNGAFYSTEYGPIAEGDFVLGENDSMMTVVLRALHDNGFAWNGSTGNQGDGGAAADYTITYLASIHAEEGTALGEFDGNAKSGWMGTLNDWFVNESFAAFTVSNGKLENGDEIHVMFTMSLGADIGSVWGSNDTSLDELTVTGGTLTPAFTGSTTSYSLIIPAGGANVTVYPVPVNKNYQSRIFLNDYNKDAAMYKRTDIIAVRPGDVIYVGVGEQGWPTMNTGGKPTKYTIKVGTADDAVNALDESKIKLSNYKDYAAKLAEIDRAGLSDAGKSKYDAVKERITFYEQIDAVKTRLSALPLSEKTSDDGVKAAKNDIKAAESAYKALNEEQKQYITVADVKNYNALVERLNNLDPSAGIQTITGSEKKKEDEGSEIAPALVTVTPEVVNGEAKAEIAAEDVSKAIEEAPDAKTLTVTVSTEGADKVEADLPADAVKAAANAGVGLNVETENGTVKLSAADVKAASGKDLAVSVTENSDGTTTIGVTAGGKAVDTKVKVELPAARDGQVLVIVAADGKETPVILSATEDGTMYAEVPAGSTVKVVDAEGKDFGDVKATDWFAEAVEFVSSHGIFEGTGDGFEPSTTMNRAMLAMVLYRIDGATGGGKTTFDDVKPEDWFADAVAWAADAGIVNGRGEGFAPDAPVTREEIATMLYRFVQYLGVDVRGSADLSAFPDGGNTSDWAKDAMAWAVSVGLFKGDDNGALNPGGEATRAEVATLVQRLIGLMVK